MMAADTQDRLTAMGSNLDRACALLLSPTPGNMDRCAQLLQAASIDLAEIPPPAAARAPELVRRLQGNIRRAAALLEHAAQFHQSWRSMLGAMCAGYRSGGSAAVLDHPSRLCVEG